MDMLRLATAGSVDDGKSTLIGRLLYDSKSIMTDRLAAVRRASHARGEDFTNLALLTDGLRAEREQGITIDQAFPPMSVTLLLADELDVARGDMLCRPGNRPEFTQDLDATVCWMAGRSPLVPRARLLLKHTTRTVRTVVRRLHYRLDINTLRREGGASQLGLNDIGRVSLRTTAPLFVDDYGRNRTTGGFILIDETTNATVGTGVITATFRN